ncbi:MAG: carbohydrate ABC transporter permease [Clostridia bacterium]|nr:carbohydrate ABC transporter permease [Clostridia bacterium]
MKTDRVYTRQSFWEMNRRSGGYLLKKNIKRWVVSLVRWLLVFGLCFMIIQPLIIRFVNSVKPEIDLYDPTVKLVPRTLTLENYSIVLGLTDMPNSMLNTLWISFLTSLCQVVATTLVAYGFARYNFPLKKFWFACVIATIVIPPQAISSSLYNTFARFDILGIIKALTGNTKNLIGSPVPYVLMCLTCMGLKDGLYIYMLRQYFKNVPKSLEEAAFVDGCGTMKTFVRIMLPDAMPIIVSCFLFAFVWQWTDVFYARNFLTSSYSIFSNQISSIESKFSRTLAGVAQGSASVTVAPARSQQLISIGVLLCSAPLIVLYLFAQRSFVESISMTGTKM